ncbi:MULTISPECIES: hypothetical protein [unclassified Nocardiopsis]|uniref:hypothetical protein n=1 Tax=unclassified Nocardiopsis TaxID=2649073 RepID=UPI00049209F0|nr:hypothetical protein [Nocardiopsis sp. CNT312]
MTYRQGDRVQFRSSRHNDQIRTGQVHEVQGKGQNARLTITDDEDQQSVRVEANQIEGKL